MSESSAINSVSSTQMDYMKLLVTQLQNQNPLEPMDNNEMASQLTQFSQLEQLETLNSNFARVLATSERTYAGSLIGKEISFMTQTLDAAQEVTRGIVQEIYNNMDGQIMLSVGDFAIGLDDVLTVTD
ncbi:flagellar hook assembly protein FlgD [Planctomycetota bacterium]